MITLKKTLFLSELYPPLIGGSCSMFASRFRQFPPDRVIVLTKQVEHSETFDHTVTYSIQRITLGNSGPKGFEWLGPMWSFFRAGLRLARQEDIQVIECARFLPEGVAGYLIAKLFRKKLVINYHGEDVCVLRNYKVERLLLKIISQGAAMNLANSTFTANAVREIGGPTAKIGVVVPGFTPHNLLPVEPEQRMRLRASFGGTPVILTIGRLQQRKGQDMVIRALPELIERWPTIRYVIVGAAQGGTANFEHTLRELASELGVNDHVIFVGEAVHADLASYYAACDVFIMANRLIPPGDVEGFGIVFLEAGFMGKPVIGGNSGGVPDAVQDGQTGLLVDGNTPHDIAQKLLMILDNPELASQMGKQGQQFALRMTSEAIFQHYQQILQEMR